MQATTFDIRNFAEKLTPAGEKDRYICPVCEGNNLTIDPKSGKYQCWNGCECKDIRDAVAPLPKKEPRPKGKTEYVYQSRDDQPLVKVTRSDDGKGNKKIFQSRWDGKNWATGLNPEVKKAIPIYKYKEVREAIAQGQTIFVVEGEGLADLLWSKGIPATTTIGGAGKYRNSYGEYKQDLEGANLVLCPDRDEPGLKHMEDIYKDFPNAKWLYAPPHNFYWTNLPKHGGCDIKDWIDDGATVDDILAAIEDRRVLVDALNKSLELEAERERPAQSKRKQRMNTIRAHWGDRLRWNTLKKQVELDGEPLPLDGLYITISDELDIDCGKDEAKDTVLKLARQKPYNPVVEYLERAIAKHPNASPDILNDIAPKYFGTDDPLHIALMRRTMIAAVARAYQPGCKHDEITILQGKQGCLKSTFWETLAGEEFFTDDLNGTEKDEVMKLSQYWMLEYAEFETAYKKKDVNQLKAFLARRKDAMRRPYGVDIEDFPRPSILVGSTNQVEFLHDPTGERRFWVIRVLRKKIPIKQLHKERDLLWASAIAAYRSGEQWNLTEQEDAWLEEANKQYQSSDPWESVIMTWADARSEVNVGDILSEVLRIELTKQGKVEQNRVASILRANGWQSGDRKRVNGRLVRPWLKPDVEQGVERGVEQDVEQGKTLATQALEKECSTCSTYFDKTSKNLEGREKIQPTEISESFVEPQVEQWNEKPETQLQQSLEGCSTSRSTSSSIGGTDSPMLNIGDKVAARDPYETKYSWVGEVTKVEGSDITVYWPEREGTTVKPEEKHEASYLRRV